MWVESRTGQHDTNRVTPKHENSEELGDNGYAAGEQARQMRNGAGKEARRTGWSWTP